MAAPARGAAGGMAGHRGRAAVGPRPGGESLRPSRGTVGGARVPLGPDPKYQRADRTRRAWEVGYPRRCRSHRAEPDYRHSAMGASPSLNSDMAPKLPGAHYQTTNADPPR